jgi:hypothetical protein
LADPFAPLLAFSWLAGLIISIAAAVYCYRITRITGGFRAWWLIIVFTILFAITNFLSTQYGILLSPSAQESSAAQLSGVALFDVVVELLMSILLFGAMFELHGTFKRQRAS